MMSGGVCCAEISRMFSDPVGDDRSRMDVWKRTSELSGRIESFRRIIEQIKGELLYAGLPLSEIFYNIASREKEPYENWLMDLAFQCQGTQEKRFADLWTDTIEKDLPELKWRGKMNPLICEPGELLEIGDREGVVRLLEYHLKRLDMEIEKRTAETSEKKKLGSWLGAAGGIFLVILLL